MSKFSVPLQKLKNMLEKHFTLNKDYINYTPEILVNKNTEVDKILLTPTDKQDLGWGGHNIKPFYLNIDTFKDIKVSI